MRLVPLGNRALLKPLEPEEKMSAGGIVLPDGVKNEKALQAEVLAVGPDEKIGVSEGNVVLIPRHSGSELEWDRQKLLIIKATDILAVIEKT